MKTRNDLDERSRLGRRGGDAARGLKCFSGVVANEGPFRMHTTERSVRAGAVNVQWQEDRALAGPQRKRRLTSSRFVIVAQEIRPVAGVTVRC